MWMPTDNENFEFYCHRAFLGAYMSRVKSMNEVELDEMSSRKQNQIQKPEKTINQILMIIYIITFAKFGKTIS